MMEKIISKVTFEGRFEDREHVVRRFVRHTEQVKERVPPEKLLVYEVGEGWQPLCDFLGAEGSARQAVPPPQRSSDAPEDDAEAHGGRPCPQGRQGDRHGL